MGNCLSTVCSAIRPFMLAEAKRESLWFQVTEWTNSLCD